MDILFFQVAPLPATTVQHGYLGCGVQNPLFFSFPSLANGIFPGYEALLAAIPFFLPVRFECSWEHLQRMIFHIFRRKSVIFVSVKKKRTFIFSETVHKKWRFILYMGAKIKNRTFFSVKKSEIFVSVIKKTDIYFFGENQRFLLALKKTGHLFLWTFIFSVEVPGVNLLNLIY